MSITLMQGDCLERMKEIPDGSVDMVLCDPPYGTTACKWDSVIPFEPMWEQLNRIIKQGGGTKKYDFKSYLAEMWDECMADTDAHLKVADKPAKRK